MARVKHAGAASRRRADAAIARAQQESLAPRPWLIYLLRCGDGTIYAGATNDIERRLAAHGRGAVKYTRGRLPVELGWLEEVGEKGEALSREAALKQQSRWTKLLLCGLAEPAT